MFDFRRCEELSAWRIRNKSLGVLSDASETLREDPRRLITFCSQYATQKSTSDEFGFTNLVSCCSGSECAIPQIISASLHTGNQHDHEAASMFLYSPSSRDDIGGRTKEREVYRALPTPSPLHEFPHRLYSSSPAFRLRTPIL